MKRTFLFFILLLTVGFFTAVLKMQNHCLTEKI